MVIFIKYKSSFGEKQTHFHDGSKIERAFAEYIWKMLCEPNELEKEKSTECLKYY